MSGIATLPDAPRIALIAMAAGLASPDDVRPLTHGTSSAAWRVESGRRFYVVRHALPAAAVPPRYQAESAIFYALYPLDARAPERIATNIDAELDPFEGRLPWAVDRMLPGAAPGVGDVDATIARDLGVFLGALHTLPSTDAGPVMDEHPGIVGSEVSFEDAALGRWKDPWPFDGRPLMEHAAAKHAQSVMGALAALRDPLLAIAAVDERAVLHGDLTTNNLLVRDGRLSGVVDFGDAWISSPGWDLASFVHHHGFELLPSLVEGYCADPEVRTHRAREATLLAVVIALHRLSRAAAEKDGARLKWALERLTAATTRAREVIG